MGQSSSIEQVLGKENIHFFVGLLLPLACCTQDFCTLG